MSDKGEWISVDERLPKSGEHVRIAYIPIGESFYWANWVWHASYTPTHSGHVDTPTHWQPPPDPPEANDE